MTSKTRVILRAADGRELVKDFATYDEAIKFVEQSKISTGAQFRLKEYHATRSPTLEVYEEKDAKKEGDGGVA